jgi:polyisoprenoid-binding protein YceI
MIRMSRRFDYTGAVRAAVGLLLAATACAFAEPIVYRVDPDITVVEYAVTYLGVLKQRGRFVRTNGAIVIDQEARDGHVDFTVDARSIDSGWSVRDNFLRDEAMLDTDRHPAIRFESTRLGFADGRLARIDGLLTLHGVRHPLALIVSRFECGGRGNGVPATCEADAAATIRRSAFGIEGFVPLIGDAVTLEFAVVAHRAPS